MSSVEILDHSIVYTNPIPTLRSRHAFFPGMERLPNGDLIAMFPIGEAFESADQQVHLTRSTDQGKTWSKAQLIHPQVPKGLGSLKPVRLKDGSLVAIGYVFYHPDPETLANPQTGGLPTGENLITISTDQGKTWAKPERLVHNRKEVLELSGPAIQIQNGDLLALGYPMLPWDGQRPSGIVGVLLRSKDGGKSWDDRSLYFNHPPVSPLEARLCQLSDGRIVAIVWALDESSGKCHPNLVVVSSDNGNTWSDPIDTGMEAQASNVLALEDGKLLSIHAHRQSEPTGIFVRHVDFSGNRWKVLAEAPLWNRAAALQVKGFADMGANLKFGQPSLLSLGNNEFLAYHWAIENGQGKILAHRLRLKP
jgi:sialidase-1